MRIAMLVALALAACGGGGGGIASPDALGDPDPSGVDHPADGWHDAADSTADLATPDEDGAGQAEEGPWSDASSDDPLLPDPDLGVEPGLEGGLEGAPSDDGLLEEPAGAGEAGEPEPGADASPESEADAAGDTAFDPEQEGPPPPIADVVLNEVGCHDPEFVEVVNRSADMDQDLGGFVLSDDLADPAARYTIPSGTMLAAGGRIVFVRKEADGTGDIPFGVKCGKDTLFLLRPEGQVIDQASPFIVPEDATWGRLPDGSGEFTTTARTPGAPNEPYVDAAAGLFNEFEVPTIDLVLPQASWDALAANPYEFVEGTFRFTPQGGEAEPELTVGIRRKGRIGSLKPLDQKAAFKVKFNWGAEGTPLHAQRFRGLKGMTLNNMVQDRSMVHEATVYRIFRAMGVPSPRTGYAWVRVNGKDYGLYLDIETADDVFLDRWYPSTEHLYEAKYGVDFAPGNEPKFEVDEGDETDTSDLAAFIALVNETPDVSWWAEVGKVADLPEMTAMWAVENFIGHWDGYAPTINNYRVHVTEDGRFSMLPWGTDQTLANHLDYYGGKGYLFRRCLASAGCRQSYNLSVARVLQVLPGLELDSFMADLSTFLQPFVEKDPKKPYSLQQQQQGVQAARDFLASRAAETAAMFACLLGQAPDADLDGYFCMDDCNDTDPSVSPGALDTCGDGIDQDCSGLADDGPDCPCVAILNDAHRYLLCTWPRGWNDARKRCIEQGADLAVFGDATEQGWLAAEVGKKVKMPELWIGLSDALKEGSFTWTDGQSLTWGAWAAGQPNNSGESDCVKLMPDGKWNDKPCSEPSAFVCEAICGDLKDEDGDGYPGCTTDCDDLDAGIHPGAPEACGDGIDQNCNGVADEALVCEAGCEPVGPAALRLTVCLPTDWDRGRDVCSALGANLLTFKDATDMAAVAGALKASGKVEPSWGWVDVWMGLDDQANEGDFRWPDGTWPDWSAWAVGQPNNGNGTVIDIGMEQDCVRFVLEYEGVVEWSGTWWDAPCSEWHAPVCRM